jgi:hypothetical protein
MVSGSKLSSDGARSEPWLSVVSHSEAISACYFKTFTSAFLINFVEIGIPSFVKALTF